MACTIEVISDDFGDDDWGIGDEQGGFVATTSVSVTERCEKAEGKDSKGCIVAIAFYNKTSEISIEGIGANPDSQVAGDTIDLTGITLDQGDAYCDEVSIEYSNEDWVKTTIKGTAYENIS